LNSKPNKDWLTYVVTSRAKNQIRSFLKREGRQQSVAAGKEMLDSELKKFGLNLNKVAKEKVLVECVARFNQGNSENLFSNIAMGHMALKQVISIVVPEEKLAKGPALPKGEKQGPLERLFRKVSGQRSGIKIGGYEDVLMSFAQCCNPLPGDPVTGFVTRGRGVTIHTSDCPMILSSEEDRRIPVDWQGHAKGLHTARFKVLCVDKPGLLAKLSQAHTITGVNISEAQIQTTSDKKALNFFTVSVTDLSQFKKLVQRIEEIDGVISVERVKTKK